ncbi:MULTISPECIES: DUF7694 domain-containing protein [unclassified Bradyrhizobium]
MQGPCGCELKISGLVRPSWEHVAVSTPRRCPNWEEMCFVKDLFWNEEECVMQLHPPHSQYVNNLLSASVETNPSGHPDAASKLCGHRRVRAIRSGNIVLTNERNGMTRTTIS